MQTRKEVIDACMTFPGVYEDYPFDDANWTLMRHTVGKKAFAMIFEREGKIWINVKTSPEGAFILRELYPSVLPAYHMNKRHWVSVVLDGRMSDADILPILSDSFDRTAPKLKKANSHMEKE